MAGRWLALQPLTESPPALRKSGKPLDCLWPVEVSMPKLAQVLINAVDIWTLETILIEEIPSVNVDLTSDSSVMYININYIPTKNSKS